MTELKRVVESRGATVELAIKAGLELLKVGRNDVIVEILDEGSRGILGIGKRDSIVRLTDVSAELRSEPSRREKPARPTAPPKPEPRPQPVVVQPEPEPEPELEPEPEVAVESSVHPEPEPPVAASPVAEAAQDAPAVPQTAPQIAPQTAPQTAPPPTAAPETGDDEGDDYDEFGDDEDEDDFDGADLPVDQAREIEAAQGTMRELLDMMGIDATVSVELSEEDDLTQERVPIIKVEGDDLGMLIGPRGKALNALQFLMRSMVSQQIKGRTTFVVDVGGYRERRMQVLVDLAKRMASKVARQGRALTLNPMPPHERRVIHMTLRNDSRVVTKSTGEGKRRRVRIMRARRQGADG